MWKRYRHLVAYLTLAVVPVFILASIAYVSAKGVMTRQSLNHLETIATLQEKRVSDYLAHNDELFMSFASRLQLRILINAYNQGDNQAQPEILSIIHGAKKGMPTIKDIDILSTHGQTIASTRTTPLENSEPITRYLREDRGSVKTLLYKDVHGQPRIMLAGPLTLDGKPLGLALIETETDKFHALTGELTGLGETGEVVMGMRNADGNVLIISRQRFHPGSQLSTIFDKSDNSKPIVRAVTNVEATHQDTYDYRGQSVLAATRYLDKPEWGLIAKIDQHEAYAPLRQFAAGLIMLVSFIMLLSAVGAIMLYRKERNINKSMDEFVSLASHQLRTPATKVKMTLGMLLEGFYGKVSRQQRDVLAAAYDSNEGQLQVINDLLQVSTTDASQMQIKPKLIDISQIVQEVAAELVPVYEKSGQMLKVQLPGRVVEAWVDRARFRMVVENLLTNAHKYTPPGGKVWVKLQKRRDSFVLTVKDTGVGIAQKDIDKLFKKFSRIHNPLSVEAGGTGLGLYLSHKIVTLHKGTLNVESTPGRGTTFIVELPYGNAPTGVREFLHLRKPA